MNSETPCGATPTEKRCGKCGEVKPAGDFSKDSSRKDGLQGRCGVCFRAYYAANREKLAARNKAYHEANPEKVAAQQKAYREANPEKVWVRNAIAMGKHRAKKFGGQHIDHTPEQFLARMSMFGDRCWICGGPWEHSDHMKPLARRGPHMLANWRPSCRDCNLRKSDMWPTPEPGEGIGQLVKQMVADIRDYKYKTEKYRRSATPCGATVLNKVRRLVTASSPTIDNASHTPKRIAE